MRYFKFFLEKVWYYILFPEIERWRTTWYKEDLKIELLGVSSTAVHNYNLEVVASNLQGQIACVFWSFDMWYFVLSMWY